MIPLREQEYIRELFQESLTGPVKLEYFTQRPAPVFIPGREECRFCEDVQRLLEELAALSGKVSLRVLELAKAGEEAKRYGVERVPATVVRGVLNRPIVITGLPAGTLFTVLLDIIVGVSRGGTEMPAPVKKRLKRVRRDLSVQLFVTTDDPDGPEVARALAALAIENGHVRLQIVEIAAFEGLAQALGIESVPLTLIDGRVRLPGPVAPETLLDQIVKTSETTVVTGPARLPGGGVALDVPKADAVQTGEVRPSGLIVPRR
jgi:alkyl hydroperoxide reductase subunit AhpF